MFANFLFFFLLLKKCGLRKNKLIFYFNFYKWARIWTSFSFVRLLLSELVWLISFAFTGNEDEMATIFIPSFVQTCELVVVWWIVTRWTLSFMLFSCMQFFFNWLVDIFLLIVFWFEFSVRLPTLLWFRFVWFSATTDL